MPSDRTAVRKRSFWPKETNTWLMKWRTSWGLPSITTVSVSTTRQVFGSSRPTEDAKYDHYSYHHSYYHIINKFHSFQTTSFCQTEMVKQNNGTEPFRSELLQCIAWSSISYSRFIPYDHYLELYSYWISVTVVLILQNFTKFKWYAKVYK